jgi:hypothetical protein
MINTALFGANKLNEAKKIAGWTTKEKKLYNVKKEANKNVSLNGEMAFNVRSKFWTKSN